MFWEQRIYGFSVLDFLGAGVPVAVLLSIFLARPRFLHLPLASPILVWAVIVWVSAGVYVAVAGNSLVVVENTLRYTCGVPIFLLTVMVVTDFERVWRLLRLWLLGAVPVAAIFYGYGERLAMEYHGVVRMKAFYHDVVTPAVVGCMSMLISLFLLGLGRMRRWRPTWILALLISVGVFGRLVYLTFHNALAGVAFLSTTAFLFLRRRFAFLGVALVLLVGLSQTDRVQQRWWREIAILRGEQDPIAFASGRPNQWRFYVGRFRDMERMDQCLGVHGTWGDPENQFIQLLGDLGPVLGLYTLGLVVWVLWTVYRWSKQEADPERKLFLQFVAAVLLGSGAAWITATPLTYSNFQWFLFCLVGLAVAVRVQSEREAAAAVHAARESEARA
jgi:O-antigen ligase